MQHQHATIVPSRPIKIIANDEIEKNRLFEECSPIHHLTKDDVPALLSYGGTLEQEVTNANIGIHHARFGKALKEKMDAIGIRCLVYAGGQVLGGGERVSPLTSSNKSLGCPTEHDPTDVGDSPSLPLKPVR